MSGPVATGNISSAGAIEILQQIELRRTTGTLRFKVGDREGDITLVAGQIALDQVEIENGRDPVEVFLGLREGRYEVYQRLPTLPVSRGDDQERSGSLKVHTPADLMNYCERAGLTGRLVLSQGEREAQIVYDAGELRAIGIDGEAESDVHDVFGWNDGTFEIVTFAAATPSPIADLVAPSVPEARYSREPTYPRIKLRSDESGSHPYKVMEMQRSTIVEEREKRRAKPTSALVRMPSYRPSKFPSAARVPREGSDRPPTVQIVYLGAPRKRVSDAGEVTHNTRHVQKSVERVSVLPEATPERRAAPDTPMFTAFGRVTMAVLIILVFFALLARLSALE